MSEGLYAVDSDGVIVLANPGFERLLGYGPRELLGVGLERSWAPTRSEPWPVASRAARRSSRRSCAAGPARPRPSS